MVHQELATLNNFFPLSPCLDTSVVMFYKTTLQGSDSRLLWLGDGWAQDIKGQVSPPDARLPHLCKQVAMPVGISVPAGLRSDPQVPSYPPAVAGEVSYPKP